MEEKILSAESAKEITSIHQLPSVLKDIKLTAMCGQSKTVIYNSLSDNTKNQLKDLGYFINESIKKDRITITW